MYDVGSSFKGKFGVDGAKVIITIIDKDEHRLRSPECKYLVLVEKVIGGELLVEEAGDGSITASIGGGWGLLFDENRENQKTTF